MHNILKFNCLALIISVPTIFSIKRLTDGWLISLQVSTYSSYTSSLFPVDTIGTNNSKSMLKYPARLCVSLACHSGHHGNNQQQCLLLTNLPLLIPKHLQLHGMETLAYPSPFGKSWFSLKVAQQLSNGYIFRKEVFLSISAIRMGF